MSHAALVSVVIPFFNAAGYLAAAVHSVVAQGQPGTEILLVDDGSTDNSARVAAALAGQFPGIRLVRLPTNGGPAAARNLGLRNATGRYVCFLDVDDEYAPGFFRRAVPLLEGNSAFAGVVTGVELIDCQREVHPLQLDAVVASLPTNLLIRKAAADLVGGFPEGPVFRGASGGEDIQFRTALDYWFSFLWCPEKFLRYRVGPSSHFHYFLDRSRVVEGKLVFTSQTAEEENGAMQAASRLYRAQAAQRMSALTLLRNRNEVFHPFTNRLLQGIAAFDDLQRTLETVSGQLHAQEGFALYHWVKEEPSRGVVVMLGEDRRLLCWLAAGSRAATREKVVAFNIAGNATTLETNLERLGLRAWVEVRSGNGVEVGGAWREPIRLLCIDGDQPLVGTMREIEMWNRQVVRGGVIAFVGIDLSDGVTQLYRDFRAAHPAWKEVGKIRGVRLVQCRE